MIFDQPLPFEEALASRAVRTVVPVLGRTADLDRLPPEIRRRAMFSSLVTDARHLETIDAVAGEILDGRLSLADAKMRIGEFLERAGFSPDPDRARDLTNFFSDGRRELQVRMNVELMQGQGKWIADQDPDLLDEMPAQELVRFESREVPREWQERWTRAGGRLFGGRMIALKNDGIWERISRFGHPYPPFDFNSGMGVEDVTREEAMELGLIDLNTRVQPDERAARINEDLELDAGVRSARLREAMEETGLGEFVDGVFVFRAA